MDNLGHGADFLEATPMARSMKETIDKLDLIKIKNFSVEETVKRMRRQATDWEKLLAKHTSDKGLLCKIYKEFLNSTIRKQTT